jgi:hypothetical protein
LVQPERSKESMEAIVQKIWSFKIETRYSALFPWNLAGRESHFLSEAIKHNQG